MASKTKNSLPGPESSADVVTLVAAGTHVVGRVTGQEDIRVQGTIEGFVRLDTTLFVEPEGSSELGAQAGIAQAVTGLSQQQSSLPPQPALQAGLPHQDRKSVV